MGGDGYCWGLAAGAGGVVGGRRLWPRGGGGEGGAAGRGGAPLQIEDGDRRKLFRMPNRAALADDARRIIQWPQKSGLGQQQEIDLLWSTNGPGGHDIDARVKNLICSVDRDARPARRIFPIGDDHVDAVRLAQLWQELPHRVRAA